MDRNDGRRRTGVSRRGYLAAAGATGTAALAGCIGYGGGGPPSGTLTVATYPSMVDGDGAAGPWLKQEFEKQYPEATVEFATPESGLNYYIQRAREGIPIEADLYVGLNVDHLLRLDTELDDDLFDSVDSIDRRDQVKEGLEFDPKGRAVPYDTGYISLVFDESEVEEPKTFADLTTDPYEGTLIVQNAQSSATGRAFLLWTVKQFGADGYLDYWRRLDRNDITVLGTWDDAYTAYSNGERPMVVSYSTDQVYANRYDQDMTRHQIGFLNEQGYANPEGMARFATAGDDGLATAFMEFVLRPEVQGEIAVRNVQFPATPNADLPETFDKYAKEPPEPVTFTYDDLKGKVDGWVEDWAREIAQG
ncbi:thiamine ABC transporter substrate-binding protein [Halorarius halobius]|uniref:thiamine ABC transporter substrate-binding protein n=1 Tax=Halorarius halobius TaxID=2962671 RepID=UPI0020CD121B|nr:thiamine ABC transporter substrate-binding protein [Halorarius halobius]